MEPDRAETWRRLRAEAEQTLARRDDPPAETPPPPVVVDAAIVAIADWRPARPTPPPGREHRLDTPPPARLTRDAVRVMIEAAIIGERAARIAEREQSDAQLKQIIEACSALGEAVEQKLAALDAAIKRLDRDRPTTADNAAPSLRAH